jgi:hypothetical protein
MSQFPILLGILEKQAQPFQKRVDDKKVDLTESEENVNIFLAPAQSAAERAAREDEESEEDVAAPAAAGVLL